MLHLVKHQIGDLITLRTVGLEASVPGRQSTLTRHASSFIIIILIILIILWIHILYVATWRIHMMGQLIKIRSVFSVNGLENMYTVITSHGNGYMLSLRRRRSIFWQYSNGSYRNIPVYMLINIYYICQRCTLPAVESWHSWPGVLVRSFPAKLPVPAKEMNTPFHCHTVLQCFFGCSTLHFDCNTCSPSDVQQWKMGTRENGKY